MPSQRGLWTRMPARGIKMMNLGRFLFLSAAFLCGGVSLADEAMAEDPFAAMLALGEAMVVDNVETGTSVRAKRGLNPLLAARLKDPTACEAKVVAVNRAGFPSVALQLSIIRPAKEGPGAAFKSKDSVVVFPKLTYKSGKVDYKTEFTLNNVGAYFLRSGDRVVFKPGGSRGRVWEAIFIERK